MIKIRVFPHNEKGKIEFTKEELQKLINEIYNEGKADNYSIYYGSNPIPAITCTTSATSATSATANKVSTSIDKTI